MSWLKNKWNSFEAWVASWMPGLKTKIVAGLGALGSFAGLAQQYVSGLPLDKFMTASQVLIVTSVLFTLAFWFRGLGDIDGSN